MVNAIAPGKRPRSPMAPTLVLDDDGEARLAVGGSGGASTPARVAEALVAMLAWDMGAQQAADLPLVVAGADGRPVSVESALGSGGIAASLSALGHRVEETGSAGRGLVIVEITEDERVRGAVDPRGHGSFSAGYR